VLQCKTEIANLPRGRKKTLSINGFRRHAAEIGLQDASTLRGNLSIKVV